MMISKKNHDAWTQIARASVRNERKNNAKIPPKNAKTPRHMIVRPPSADDHHQTETECRQDLPVSPAIRPDFTGMRDFRPVDAGFVRATARGRQAKGRKRRLSRSRQPTHVAVN